MEDPSQCGSHRSDPLPERFYGGGGSTMRGYPQNQAGPRDPARVFRWVFRAVFNSTEVASLLCANIRGFVRDFGNVFSSIGSMSFPHRPTQYFRLQLHVARGWLRNPLQTPLSSAARRCIQYHPPEYNGFAGDYTHGAMLASGTCQTSTQHISHFQFFFSIRSGLLMRNGLSFVGRSSDRAAGICVIVDRSAIRLATRSLRIARLRGASGLEAFQNGKLPVSVLRHDRGAQRLIDLRLVNARWDVGNLCQRRQLKPRNY